MASRLIFKSLVPTLAIVVAVAGGAAPQPVRAADVTPPASSTLTAPVAGVGQQLFGKIQALEGTWEAQSPLGVTTDIFRPFAVGTAVLQEEWFNGKETQATVYYVVHGELYADHYCDAKNQTYYTAVPTVDPNEFDFEYRSATNVDVYPIHAEYTRWRLTDPTHLIQDWFVVGGKKPVFLIHMEFAKKNSKT